MELLKAGKRRGLISESLYVVLNLVLVAVIFAAVQIGGVPWLAFGLVLLSKWRVFAVRPRYWPANIRANLIDAIVGLSIVVFMWVAVGSLVTQLIFAVLYAVWLLFIKPRSKRTYVSTQALVGTALGTAAIIQLSPPAPTSLVVVLMWMVGYSAARHIMSSEHEAHINFLSLLWGFIIAEIGWLTYHWTIGYGVTGSFQLPQTTVIIVVLSFAAERVYTSLLRHGSIRMSDIVLPLLLSISVITVLLLGFNQAVAI